MLIDGVDPLSKIVEITHASPAFQVPHKPFDGFGRVGAAGMSRGNGLHNGTANDRRIREPADFLNMSYANPKAIGSDTAQIR